MCGIIIGALLISFFCTTFVFWGLTMLLPIFGIVITFSWGKALAFWLILILVKALFGSSDKS